MRYRLAAPILVSILVGCVSPQVKLTAFNESWAGHPLDDFVRANGMPATQYTMSDGSNLYTFVFGQGSVQMPSNTTITGSTATTTGGGNIDLACVLRLESNPEGIITRIEIERDTIGLWVNSRCHEALP